LRRKRGRAKKGDDKSDLMQERGGKEIKTEREREEEKEREA